MSYIPQAKPRQQQEVRSGGTFYFLDSPFKLYRARAEKDTALLIRDIMLPYENLCSEELVDLDRMVQEVSETPYISDKFWPIWDRLEKEEVPSKSALRRLIIQMKGK